jgi:hypothetical protein
MKEVVGKALAHGREKSRREREREREDRGPDESLSETQRWSITEGVEREEKEREVRKTEGAREERKKQKRKKHRRADADTTMVDTRGCRKGGERKKRHGKREERWKQKRKKKQRQRIQRPSTEMRTEAQDRASAPYRYEAAPGRNTKAHHRDPPWHVQQLHRERKYNTDSEAHHEDTCTSMERDGDRHTHTHPQRHTREARLVPLGHPQREISDRQRQPIYTHSTQKEAEAQPTAHRARTIPHRERAKERERQEEEHVCVSLLRFFFFRFLY